MEAALLGARRAGHDGVALLARAGIAPTGSAGSAGSAVHGRVSVCQFTRLVRVLLEVLDDEFLGRTTQKVPRGAFAVMCESAVHADDLAHALRRMCRFYRLLPGAPPMRLRPEQDTLRFECAIAPESDPDRFLSESMLRLTHHFASWLIGRRTAVRLATFPYPPPAHAGDYPIVFGCPARFCAGTLALVFSPAALPAPIVRDEHSLERFLRCTPSPLLCGRDEDITSVADQVRGILERSLDGEVATPGEVARRLRVSQQTLRRRLAREKTSFAEIRDALFRDIAISTLAAGTGSVSYLAERLGFSEPSAFRRAFKRWTGSSPSAFHPGKLAG
ncbi:AraC family transcriptional regulator [Amycolatopsis arida]|uniref:AraC family transcriptional regulator n=1 Tax=Amycolatopsis arida TaxID=587909 RepID=UPI001FB9DA07|nr:AraC family transcriptional regulator [Amycolatopsis arida]